MAKMSEATKAKIRKTMAAKRAARLTGKTAAPKNVAKPVKSAKSVKSTKPVKVADETKSNGALRFGVTAKIGKQSFDVIVQAQNIEQAIRNVKRLTAWNVVGATQLK